MATSSDPFWPMASPLEQGMDASALIEADHRIVEAYPSALCLLVVRRGSLVFERYYGGHDQDSPFDVRSITKSIVSTVVGMLIGDGRLALSQALGELLPDRLSEAVAPDAGAITVEHLLTMTAGFAWDDLADWSRLWSSEDWLETVLGTPMTAAPGSTFTYNSGCSQLLSAIVTRVTGKRLADLVAERLFQPLGIIPSPWPHDPQGYTIGGVGLEMRARDLAKVGLLYLNQGRWGDLTLLPAGYAQRATARQSQGGDPEDAAYGYHWWVTEDAGKAAFFAAGYGGQYLYVVPALDLIVVTTAHWQLPPEETPELRGLIEELIVPAVTVPNDCPQSHAG